MLALDLKLILGAHLRVTDPGVLHELCGRDARVRVRIKDSAEEVAHLFVAQVRRQLRELAALNFSEQVGFKLAKEWQFADVDDVKDDSTGPHIGSGPVIRLLSHNIGVHVVGRAAENTQLLISFDSLTEAKIDDFDVFGVELHQNVV